MWQFVVHFVLGVVSAVKVRSKKRQSRNAVLDHQVGLLDDLAEFEEFRDKLLPVIRKMLRNNASAADILKLGESVAAARTVMEVVNGKGAGRAARDLLDRVNGKPTERRENVNTLSSVQTEQLLARLKTIMADLRGEQGMDELMLALGPGDGGQA